MKGVVISVALYLAMVATASWAECPYDFPELRPVCDKAKIAAVYAKSCAFVRRLSSELCALPQPGRIAAEAQLTIADDGSGSIFELPVIDRYGGMSQAAAAAYISSNDDAIEIGRKAQRVNEEIRQRFPPNDAAI